MRGERWGKRLPRKNAENVRDEGRTVGKRIAAKGCWEGEKWFGQQSGAGCCLGTHGVYCGLGSFLQFLMAVFPGGFEPMQTINQLCDVVRETAYAIHVYHGHGHLIVELKATRAIADEHVAQLLGYLSTVREITDALSAPSPCPLPGGARGHRTVISRTVLKSSKIEYGLLINFGSYRFFIKRAILSQSFLARRSGSILSSLFLPFLSFVFPAFFCGYIARGSILS